MPVSAVWRGWVLPWPRSRAMAGLANRTSATEAGIIMARTERRPEPKRAMKAISSSVEWWVARSGVTALITETATMA